MMSERINGDPNPIGQKRSREFLLGDPGEPPRRARRRRWAALLASLLVAGFVGVFSARYLTAQRTITQSYSSSMLNDLERLVTAQSRFRNETGKFANQGELGVAFVPSQAVHVTIVAADQTGWNAYANHLRSNERCVVTVGTGPSVLRNVPSAKPSCGT